jgi:N-acetylglutamate synthase-like GNAT family acetyltransferase
MSVVVRPLRAADLPAAQDIHRLAFARFFGVDPATFRPGNRTLATRATTHPDGGLVAEEDGRLVGSAVIMAWGRIAVVGPITVHPDRWSGGIGRALMAASTARIDAGPFDHAALFTHPQSATHLRLYQSFGFWPGQLTAVMSREIAGTEAKRSAGRPVDVAEAREIAQAVYAGLDLTREIEGLLDQGLGSVLAVDGGFAICHFGAGSEARAGALYVKFAAARPGDAKGFAALLEAIEAEAVSVGAARVALGVSCARRGAYRALLDRGYRVEQYGVNMHRPDDPGWDLPDRYVIDDLR